jgi:hypothetical protein
MLIIHDERLIIDESFIRDGKKTAAAMAKQLSADREPLQGGDGVFELNPSPHPLVAKVEGPSLVLRLLGRGECPIIIGADILQGIPKCSHLAYVTILSYNRGEGGMGLTEVLCQGICMDEGHNVF